MSWECRYLRETFCDNPGEPGCVLRGRVSFPLKDAEKAPEKREPPKRR